MSNFVEANNLIAVHPGYYLKEVVDASGLGLEEFARRLTATPDSLSLLMEGEQRLTPEMAERLSELLGTSVAYWLNLQSAYDEALAKISSKNKADQINLDN